MKNNTTMTLILISVCIFALSGCVGAKVSPNAVTLGVNFTFEKEHKCSSISPEITVTNIPAATKKLKVSLRDNDVPTWDHGGGTVAYDGSGVIPAGALKGGYNGPCPPGGSHNYVFTVQAMDAEGVIVGSGNKSQMFP